MILENCLPSHYLNLDVPRAEIEIISLELNEVTT